MRIISGTLGGRRFSPPARFKARPTTDYAKESLFNVLQHLIDFQDCTVLDLFSGTGSISYEFASRGAEKIVAVEQHFSHCRFIKKTIEQLAIQNHQLIKADVFRFLKKHKGSYDIVFADPPYDADNISSLPDLVFDTALLNKEGVFVLEHSSKYNFNHHPHFSQSRNYGSVFFSFFEMKQS